MAPDGFLKDVEVKASKREDMDRFSDVKSLVLDKVKNRKLETQKLRDRVITRRLSMSTEALPSAQRGRKSKRDEGEADDDRIRSRNSKSRHNSPSNISN